MEKMLQDVHEGKIDPKGIDKGFVLASYNELNTAAGKGYGKDWIKVNKSTGNISPEVIQMQRNLYKFSGAKSTVVLQEINQLLQKQLPYKEFENEVLKLNPKYNKNYLQAEWQTANQSAKHARDWQYYLDNAHIYPNLIYKTEGDSRVRDSHAKLNDIIAPIGGDFWKTHNPPNGYRCRCFVKQTAETPTTEDKIPILTEKEFPKEFRINTGESGQIFSEGNLNDSKAHPYFALAKNKDWEKSFELAKLAAPANEVLNNGKNTLKVSPFADEKDLQENIRDAKKLIEEFKVNIEIRAHLDGEILKNFKNPEYLVDGEIGDRKEPETAKIKNLRNIYRSANEQGCKTMVISLKKTTLTLDEVMEEIRKKFKTFPNISTVYVIDKTNKAYKIEKQVNK